MISLDETSPWPSDMRVVPSASQRGSFSSGVTRSRGIAFSFAAAVPPASYRRRPDSSPPSVPAFCSPHRPQTFPATPPSRGKRTATGPSAL